MRVTRNTGDTLIIEEGTGTKLFLGWAFVAIGSVGLLIWWKDGEPLLFLIVGAVFAFYGLKMLLFYRTQTHRFERWRGKLITESKGLWGSRRRELPLDSIADVVLEEIRSRGTSYYIYHMTKDGQRIDWAKTYDGSKENTLECFLAARKFLGLPEAPAGADGAPER